MTQAAAKPVVRLISYDEIDLLMQIARLHVNVIETGFLSKLGPAVLVEFYRTIAQSEGSFVLATLSDGNDVQAFIAGSAGTHSLYREHLRLRSWKSLAKLFFALARPTRLLRVIETVRYSEGTQTGTDLPDAEILNFCVDPKAQRSGLGQVLMHALDAEFLRRGFKQIRIVTGATQTSAQNFYRKIGAIPVGDIEVHAGTQSSLFLWDLSSPSTNTSKEP